jgi:hypothetical protein
MSDHLSSPRAVAEPATDLTDLFAFPSASNPGQLVLAMDVCPWAQPGSLFSEAASYRFRLRPVTIPAAGRGHFGVGADEYAITCTFGPPAPQAGTEPPVQEGTCTLPDGTAVGLRVNDEQGGQAHGVRVFAGLRSDPNFLDIPKAIQTLATRQITFQEPGSNSVQGLNVLSIVLELDAETVLGPAPGPLLAVAAETVTAGKRPLRVERFGRTEVKNLLLMATGSDTLTRDLDLRELYNQEDPFELAPDYLDAYRARLNANLALMDGLDGKTDWPLRPDGTHPLTELFLGDYLVVDLAKPYAEDGYLEIEQALLRGRTHTTCGGRTFNNDSINAMYTLIFTGGIGPRISDGVHHATVRASQAFPYLARPNPGSPRSPGTVFPARLDDAAAMLAGPATPSRAR